MRALRCVFSKRVPLHGDNYGLSLSNLRLQDITILIFKAVNGMLPGYISGLFVVRNNVKCLERHQQAIATALISAKVWNSLRINNVQ